MATNSKVYVSPGVYTSERELSFVAQSVGITTLGIAGETLKGPAFEPIFVTNFEEFQAFFGGTSPEKFYGTQIPKYEAPYIAKSYLQQSNQMFITRILGLSGYDAGPSWSIQTIANVDIDTVNWTACTPNPVTCEEDCVPQGIPFTVDWTGCTNDDGTIMFTTAFPAEIEAVLDRDYNGFTGGIQSIEADMKEQVMSVMLNNSLSASSVYYFGTIANDDVPAPGYTSLNGLGYTAETNVFGVANVSSSGNTLSSPMNTTWYYALFDNYSGDSYSGFSFYTIITDLVNITPVTTTTTAAPPVTTTTTFNPCTTTTTTIPVTTTTTTVPVCYSGTVSGIWYGLTGTSYTQYNNMVVATFRSRGQTYYTNTQKGPLYEVDNLYYVNLDFSGSYAAAGLNPYAEFGVQVTNISGQTFNFETSLLLTDSNYIEKVFGLSNFAKPKTEIPVYIEENFSYLLRYGYNKGYIRGLRQQLVRLDGARTDVAHNGIGYYLEKYQTPETPWLVSELRGNTTARLFKFIAIADGNSGNQDVKVSIMNVSFEYKNFDVMVRDYYDTDDAPIVLEKYTNCSMDPSLNSFVGKRIGTADGDYALVSRYIMVQLDDDFPTEAVPCGFEGYNFRLYDGVRSPFPVFKTKYDYPGEVIYYPPGGVGVGGLVPVSTGDNVRRTYLGFSTQIGYDPEMFQYYGKRNISTNTDFMCYPTLTDWFYLTRGFHMDSGATVCTIPNTYVTSGQPAFYCGEGSFTSEPLDAGEPYYRINTRKYTVLFAGGFDGWDVYAPYRNNSDRYQIGAQGYLRGACPSARYPLANGPGLFTGITVADNTQDYVTTDFYAYLLGIRTFANSAAVNINVFVTPGIDYVNNLQLVKRTIDMIEIDRADSLYIVTTPDYDMFVPTLTNSLDLIYPQAAVDNLIESGLDSSYTATYYPWVLTRDSVTNTQVYIPATAEVTRNLALTDNISFPWFASAGYTRGLVNSVKARRKLTQDDRDTLYIGRINPIATFGDVGTVIWGNKTLQVKESALDRINVRRLLLQARKLISAVAVRLLFEQNDAKVRQDFLDSVNPILDAIRRDRGLYDFRVTVSSATEDIDTNSMSGKIYIKPTKALEFIDIEFLITPAGASFENI